MKNEAFMTYIQMIKRLNESVGRLEIDGIFSLEKSIVGSLLRYADVREYTETISKGSKRFIVMENDFAFDIMRVECNSNLRKIYELLKPEHHPSVDHASDIILRLLDVYLDSTWIKAKTISNCIEPEMFAEKILSYSWLQRKSSAISLFKNCGNPSELLRFTVAELVKSGELKEVPEGQYKTKAKLYKICIVRKGNIQAADVVKPVDMTEQNRHNQMEYIKQNVIPKLLKVGDDAELEINDSIILTFNDIREYLTSISKGVTRYVVSHKGNKFIILRTLDNYDLNEYYSDVDKVVDEKPSKRKTTKKPVHVQPIPEAFTQYDDDNDDDDDTKPADTSPEALARAEAINKLWK